MSLLQQQNRIPLDQLSPQPSSSTKQATGPEPAFLPTADDAAHALELAALQVQDTPQTALNNFSPTRASGATIRNWLYSLELARRNGQSNGAWVVSYLPGNNAGGQPVVEVFPVQVQTHSPNSGRTEPRYRLNAGNVAAPSQADLQRIQNIIRQNPFLRNAIVRVGAPPQSFTVVQPSGMTNIGANQYQIFGVIPRPLQPPQQ